MADKKKSGNHKKPYSVNGLKFVLTALNMMKRLGLVRCKVFAFLTRNFYGAIVRFKSNFLPATQKNEMKN